MRENTKGFITGKREKFAKVMPSSLRSCYFQSVSKFRCSQKPLIRTLHYYGQFAFFLVKESPYIFSTFSPLNVDSPF